jgi:hypothetical protein
LTKNQQQQKHNVDHVEEEELATPVQHVLPVSTASYTKVKPISTDTPKQSDNNITGYCFVDMLIYGHFNFLSKGKAKLIVFKIIMELRSEVKCG